MIAHIFVLASVFVLALAQAPSTKPVWDPQFDAPFGMYAPQNAFGSGLPAIVNATSHFYYKWTGLKATMIDYPQQCLPFKPFTNGACQLYFVPSGTWFYYPALMKQACLLFPGVGSVPPAFLAPFDWLLKSITTNQYDIPVFVDVWAGHNATDFQYWTDANGEDVAFVDGGAVMWRFGTLNFAEQDPSKFVIPGGDDPSRVCAMSVHRMVKPQAVPYVKLAKLHAAYNA